MNDLEKLINQWRSEAAALEEDGLMHSAALTYRHARELEAAHAALSVTQPTRDQK